MGLKHDLWLSFLDLFPWLSLEVTEPPDTEDHYCLRLRDWTALLFRLRVRADVYSNELFSLTGRHHLRIYCLSF